MTHYMELLAQNQPWNLIVYMAIPVVLAETIAITELHILFTRRLDTVVRKINRIAGILAGVYFLGIFVHLTWTAVIPLTSSGGWRGPADVIAVGFYLAGVVPLVGIAFLELGLLYSRADERKKMAVHAIFVALFLVVAHVAMIFGMLDPNLLSGHFGSGLPTEGTDHMRM